MKTLLCKSIKINAKPSEIIKFHTILLHLAGLPLGLPKTLSLDTINFFLNFVDLKKFCIKCRSLKL